MFELALVILIFTLLYLIYTITYNINEKDYIDKLFNIYNNNLQESQEIIKNNQKEIKKLRKEIKKYESK